MALDEQEAEEAARRRRWRRIRTSVTLLVLAGFVVGAAWYSWRSVTRGDEPTATSTTPTCASGGGTLTPADVQLNVYNATDRRGLAAAIAGQLSDRGFIVVDIDNDPLDKTISGPAEVRSNASQQAAVALVAALVPGSVHVADERSEAVIDLVLGDAFESLAAADAPAAPATGLPTCEPTS